MFGRQSNPIVLEPVSGRVRAVAGGGVIVDTIDAVLLREGGRAPVYYFPLRDVAEGVLVPTDRTSHCPLKGQAMYYSARLADGRIADNGVWRYPHPIAGVEGIAERVAFYPNVLDRIIAGEDAFPAA